MSAPRTSITVTEQESLLGGAIPAVNYGAASPDTDSIVDDEAHRPGLLGPHRDDSSNGDKSGPTQMRARLKYIFPALAIGVSS